MGKHKDRIYLGIGILILICLCMHDIYGIYGFTFFPDEFGYWAPAAKMLGYDWSRITALGSFYSYGYSIVLLPVLKFFTDAIVTYRMAIVVNMIMHAVSIVLLYHILIEVIDLNSKDFNKEAAIASAFAALTPSWVTYTKSTMTESYLCFLYILICFLMLRFLKKKRAVNGILLALVTIYMYFVHMRCMGMILSVMLTLFFYMIGKRKSKKAIRNILIVLAIVIALFLISFVIYDFVIAGIYKNSSKDVLAWNNIHGQVHKIRQILSLEGILTLIEDLPGKILYVCMATYGLFAWGFIYIIARIRKEKSEKRYFYLFLLLSFLGQFGVELVYLYGASNKTSTRLELLFHGRYIDFVLSVCMAIGLIALLREEKILTIWKKTVFIMLFSIVMMCFGYLIILRNPMHFNDAHSSLMLGMSFFLNEFNPDVPNYLWKEVIVRLLILLVITALVIFYKKRRTDYVFAAMALIQILGAIYFSNNLVMRNQSYIYGDLIVGDKLQDIRKERKNADILYLYEDAVQYIEIVQFANKDADINVIYPSGDYVGNSVNENMIVLCDYNSAYCKELSQRFDNKYQMGHFIMYYND